MLERPKDSGFKLLFSLSPQLEKSLTCGFFRIHGAMMEVVVPEVKTGFELKLRSEEALYIWKV